MALETVYMFPLNESLNLEQELHSWLEANAWFPTTALKYGPGTYNISTLIR